jgi:hypothetical protein
MVVNPGSVERFKSFVRTDPGDSCSGPYLGHPSSTRSRVSYAGGADAGLPARGGAVRGASSICHH